MLNFKAGNISNFLDASRDITDDRNILETVCGLPAELEASRVADLAQPIHPHSRDFHQFSMEISKLPEKCVIKECIPETGTVLSPVFLRKKVDGKHRQINVSTLRWRLYSP